MNLKAPSRRAIKPIFKIPKRKSSLIPNLKFGNLKIA